MHGFSLFTINQHKKAKDMHFSQFLLKNCTIHYDLIKKFIFNMFKQINTNCNNNILMY